MNKPDLAVTEARCSAATPGPWWSSQRQAAVQVGSRGAWWCPPFSVNETQGIKDADFMAHAREDVPALVVRVRELEKALAEAIECAHSNECGHGDDKGDCDYTADWDKLLGGG